jgi:hypothetical protein
VLCESSGLLVLDLGTLTAAEHPGVDCASVAELGARGAVCVTSQGAIVLLDGTQARTLATRTGTPGEPHVEVRDLWRKLLLVAEARPDLTPGQESVDVIDLDADRRVATLAPPALR